MAADRMSSTALPGVPRRAPLSRPSAYSGEPAAELQNSHQTPSAERRYFFFWNCHRPRMSDRPLKKGRLRDMTRPLNGQRQQWYLGYDGRRRHAADCGSAAADDGIREVDSSVFRRTAAPRPPSADGDRCPAIVSTRRQIVSATEKLDSMPLVLLNERRKRACTCKSCSVRVSSRPSIRLAAALGFSSFSSLCNRYSACRASLISERA